MRLLYYGPDGKVALTQDMLPRNAPPYAILSHTWGPEEVTFEDMQTGLGGAKRGYNKILFCGEQAYRDGLEYFWVDTCCIKKTDSTELQEAINSMFQWYKKARKCYVYMEDVTGQEARGFAESRWFTRGWTLQELLAPKHVEFYSKDRVALGDKTTLEQEICDATGLPEQALRGRELSRFDIGERFAWIEGRDTTREEDLAYCLLGIFGVFMPLLYGEGRENAFARLWEAVNKPATRPAGMPFVGQSARHRKRDGQEPPRLQQYHPTSETFNTVRCDPSQGTHVEVAAEIFGTAPAAAQRSALPAAPDRDWSGPTTAPGFSRNPGDTTVTAKESFDQMRAADVGGRLSEHYHRDLAESAESRQALQTDEIPSGHEEAVAAGAWHTRPPDQASYVVYATAMKLSDPDASVRRDGAKDLKGYYLPAYVIQALAAHLDDSDIGVQWAVIDTLSSQPHLPPKILQALNERRNDLALRAQSVCRTQ